MQIPRHHDGMARGRKSIFMRFQICPYKMLLHLPIVSKITICGGKLHGNVYQAYRPRDKLSHDVLHSHGYISLAFPT